MPALVAFGRRWQIASDDFVFPGFIDLLVRVSWLIAGCIIFWKHDINLDCPGGNFLRYYLYGNFVVLLSVVFADIALIQNSMAGYIVDQESRKYVVPCLYLRLTFEIPEIGWNIMGTIWVFGETLGCEEAPQAVFLIKGLIICNWVLVVVMIFVIALVFDPHGSSSATLEHAGYERFQTGVWSKNHRVWERRCRLLLCSCTGNDEFSRDAFKEVGKIMSYLVEDVDFVPSDLAAGLIILHLKTQAEASALRNISYDKERNGDSVITQEPFMDDIENSVSTPSDKWNSPQYIAHFMKFALGSYGWPWYVIAHMKTGICRLWENLLCCGCCINHPCAIEGDNCCYCNTSALKDTIKVQERDLIYASFKNQVYETPFFVSLDHSTKSVVVAIRGTMSLRDALTDLTAEAKTLDSPDIPQEVKAHNGMILAAKNVLKKLESLNLLGQAFVNNPDYTLVIAGHSLGAGTATILSILLKSQYPNLRCYAYSAPGGLLTMEGAQYCEDFVTSVIVGDDIVGRLSVPSFEKFKKTLESAINQCRTPKYRILVGGCFYVLMGGSPNLVYGDTREETQRTTSSDTNLLASAIEPPNYHTYVSLAEVSHRRQRESVTNCPMFPPGRILHVTERPIFASRPDLIDGPRYQYRWAHRSEFCEVKVTPKMMMDHYPDNVYRALRDIANAEPCPYSITCAIVQMYSMTRSLL
ncbi:unnamed protein product [Allacma fusca]|uniref:Fungal lipase-type domain-containing protein n=1 Tax=Allacma fusca TaxID=39272 RepID=A0A8J2LVD1_9HEXA|nr:unnamed protein product [Allacma fusca]